MANVIEFTIKGVDQFSRVTGKFSNAIVGAGKSVLKFGSIVAGLGAVVAIPILNTSRAFEKMEASLATVTGSADKAAKAMAGIRTFAQETPFQVSEITKAFIKLTSLGLEPSEAALRSYGNTASAMGKSLDQFIEAVADATTNEFERLKEFGIKAKQEGDNVSFTFQGVTTTVKKSSEDISRFLQSIGEQQFAGAMEVQMKTLDGRISNLKDNVDNLFDTIGKAGGLELAKTAIGALSESIKNMVTPVIRLSVVVGLAFEKIKNKINDSVGGGTAFRDMLTIAIQVLVALLNKFNEFGVLSVKILISSFRIAFQTMFELGKLSFQRLFDYISGNEHAISLEQAMDEMQRNTKDARDNIILDFGDIKDAIVSSVKGGVATIADFMGITTEEIDKRVGEISAKIQGVQGELATSSEETALKVEEVWDLVFTKMTELQEKQGALVVETAEIMGKAMQSLINKTSDAVAESIVEGKSLAESMKSVMKSVIKSIISALVRMAIQRQITATVSNTAAISQMKVETGALAATAVAKGTTSFAGAPWPVNLGAVAFGLAMGSVVASAVSKARSNAGQAHGGGVLPRDGSYNMEGGEIVIPRNPSQDVVDALGEFGGGGGINIGSMHFFENATNADALLNMSDNEWKDIVEDKIINALSSLDDEGIRSRQQERGI